MADHPLQVWRGASALVSLAIGPCGCGYGIECNDDEIGHATVARWKSEGATVEHVPLAEAKERVVLDCPHEPRYGLLPLSEARAEAIRLRAENEALKGWAVIGQGGYCIHSKTVEDCAGCQIRVLGYEIDRLREALAESERHRIRPAGPDRTPLPPVDEIDEPGSGPNGY